MYEAKFINIYSHDNTVMSSNDSISMVLKCMFKGAADFLIKPVRKNELRNLWQHVWRRQTVCFYIFTLLNIFGFILFLCFIVAYKSTYKLYFFINSFFTADWWWICLSKN